MQGRERIAMQVLPSENTAVSIADLRAAINGTVIAPGDAEYDGSRTVFYGGFDAHPAVIVRAADASDVSHVVSLARETGVELAIRSGGHSGAGHGTTDGGILLDLGDMKALEIDVDERIAWVEPGLTAAEFTQAAAAHGLGVGFGDAGSVGIGGITLGGGLGFLARKHGLTIDSLLAADVVTADGRLRRVDAQTDPNLF
ncbi:MAG: FAD-binding oxidoreductase, partial [Actinomycetota bacterium]